MAALLGSAHGYAAARSPRGWSMGLDDLLGPATLGLIAKALPPMRETERAALEAGTVGFEGNFFAGRPDFDAQRTRGPNRLSAEEQSVLDDATARALCGFRRVGWLALPSVDLHPGATRRSANLDGGGRVRGESRDQSPNVKWAAAALVDQRCAMLAADSHGPARRPAANALPRTVFARARPRLHLIHFHSDLAPNDVGLLAASSMT